MKDVRSDRPLDARSIRRQFLDFFKSKGHEIVPSAPLVIKDDPTLMFTNAGMNQFKDYFLGNKPAPFKRAADTQKCLRVSGKHNDLEEVGHDTYHHTMFEMLGNWSFGDYFKKDAVNWSWELLVDVYGLPKDRLYATVFGGDEKEGLAVDNEAFQLWQQYLPADHILYGSKKDNFWEMGDTGPCGPCTEVHIDLRSDAERAAVPGHELVNRDHPQVVEIWNNVFMEFNRLANGSLQQLPAQHVDTGMGFERLCMALQGKTSNYDTDVFQPLIQQLAAMSGFAYGQDEKKDIAMRVIADHVRAISFAITDGQLPSNVKAGYVIRRILRRAVRYGYNFLNFSQPFIYKLVPVLAEQFADVFPEMASQQDFVARVIQEEEASFLRTLETGLRRLQTVMEESKGTMQINGKVAFELNDTYGFPLDLTALIARENGFAVDTAGFEQEMAAQKARSRSATAIEAGDWVLLDKEEPTQFVGYDLNETTTNVIKWRKLKAKNETSYQLVLGQTPFYAESGGQVGDTGVIITAGGQQLAISDTRKENDLIVHFTKDKAVETAFAGDNADNAVTARIDVERRLAIRKNHSATHLLHSALRLVLGDHVAQKGSLVSDKLLRFDFSHFAKMTDDELQRVAAIVNQRIGDGIALDERRDVPIDQAKALGATALFGEKYGDKVRVIIFDPSFSIELCGGTHVPNTAEIGLFVLNAETSVAAGVRRVEALTGEAAQAFINGKLDELAALQELLKNPADSRKALQQIIEENSSLRKQLEELQREKLGQIRQELVGQAQARNGVQFIKAVVPAPNAEAVKQLAFDLRNQVPDLFLVLGAEIDAKPHLAVMLSDSLVQNQGMDASKIVRQMAQAIKGGGGGQPFFATAGGKDVAGLTEALSIAETFLN